MQDQQLQLLQLEKLNHLLNEVWERNPFYTHKWCTAGVAHQHLSSLHQLRDFPFTTRDELLEDQNATPPAGTNLTFPFAEYKRIHRSSDVTKGPIFWADTAASWRWVTSCSQLLFAMAGVQPSDRVFFAFSFGTSANSWMMYEGASQMGCCCFTAGDGDPEVQIAYLRQFNPSVLVISPLALFAISNALRKMGVEASLLGVKKLISYGKEGWRFQSVRTHVDQVWKADCFDRYGITEVGSIAGECMAHSGMHLLEKEYIAEVIHPETCEPMRDGELGELVLTNLGRAARPVIRYRTGDLVRLQHHHQCGCGRSGSVLVGGVVRKT